MMTYHRIRRALYNVWTREDGSMTLEFLIFAPLMFWIFIASFAYFDAYRTEAVNQKAAMTIADMISREDNYITDTYIDGAYGLLRFLTRNDTSPEMRISALRFHTKDSSTKDDGQDHFHVVWSETREQSGAGTKVALTDSEVATMSAKLPFMGDGDRLILVETWSDFTSAYNVGLKSIWSGSRRPDDSNIEMKDIVLTSHIFTAPRLAQTCFNNDINDDTKRLC